MALTIATGFVVDDAIVMIENISRYIEQGEPPLEAALKGAGQIGFTIISLTVSLIAVLIPLLFMGDVVGRLFREFAVTLAVTILISAVVSLTLVPMLCAKLLKHRPDRSAAGRPLPARWFDRADRLATAARLTWVLDHQRLTLLVAIGTLALTALLYVVDPEGLLPGPGHRPDPGHLRGRRSRSPTPPWPSASRRWPPRSSRTRTSQSLSSFIGVDGNNVTLNSGRFLINLKPRDQRSFDGQRGDPPPATARPRTSPASRSTCSRCRT